MSQHLRRAAVSIAAFLFAVIPCAAFAAQARITAPIDNSVRSTIVGSRPGRAIAANDIGALPGDTQLPGISLVFSRSAAQQADLDTLLAALQDPASPLYHQWLTPDQFAARFGAAAADIATVQGWLQQQGFALGSVSRSRDRISFSGTAAQVAAAFGTELHLYKSAAQSGSETHFAPSADLSIPAPLAPAVLAVNNLSSFRPQSRIVAASAARPRFTSAQTGNHFITPLDVATIYDVNSAYSAGYTGSNQSIAVVGQSLIAASDITSFQTALGLPSKPPTMVLVPSSGPAAVSYGDETESDLDVEYSGAIAKGAQIFFVYTGDTSTYGAFDALQYAISERISPIISVSYGDCEPDLGSSYYATLNGALAEAAAQGQTVVSAAGDAGSTDCYGDAYQSTAIQQSLAVDFPASSQYVTGLGGTEFPAADVATGNNTYFAAATTADVVSSALSYIPEQAWNDDSAGYLSSGGGGVSIYTPRPTWQAGVAGIPAGSYRLVPDISLDSSPNNAPYAFCTSDPTYYGSGQETSCTAGLRDSYSQSLTVLGGTSFAAPIFSGMLALINQKINSTGQGTINPTLYTLAANAATYASAFHDTTSGSNECLSGSPICTSTGASAYPTTTGYDEATGLGSIDLGKLLTAWPATAGGGSTLVSTTVTLSAASPTPSTSTADTITITVAPTSGGGTLTGTVSVTVDGTVVNAALALVNGTATFSFSSATVGAHVIVVTYSGNATYAASTASLPLNVGALGFTLVASNISVQPGAEGTTTITVTPYGGYTGTVVLILSSSANLNDSCTLPQVTVNVTGTAAVTAPYPIYTSVSSCNSAGLAGTTPLTRKAKLISSVSPMQPARSPFRPAPVGIGLAGLLALGCFRKRSRSLRRLQGMLAIALLMAAGLGLSGCSNNASSSLSAAPQNQAAGSYPITVTGTDSANAGITTSATFTLTVQ